MVDNSQFEEISPNFKKALIQKAPSVHPFWGLLGLELHDIKKGWAIVRLPFDKKLTQADGIAHGGATFSTADAAVAMALVGLIGRDETMVTLEMKINYLKPFDRGAIMAEAVIVQKGSRLAVGEVSIRSEEGELVAKGMATFMILQKS
ncbi:MAG: PaaI family thioesterase [Desulfobacteraceae bacterium]|nr:PaaI family thioesterase [Desulfobacteraceae bacterium]